MLCAVSGGLDSMCLLYFLDTWGPTAGFTAAAAHFNHQLRGETADRDEDFVRTWCAERNIPYYAGRGDTRALMASEGLSMEAAARKLRYAFLEETAERAGFDAILTAHHADDNAETVLLNLIRGTGSAGLAGIPAQRGNLFRPFLQITRDTLAAYAAAYQIPYVEDETNACADAAERNLLRLEVMPLLRRINPRAAEHMSAAAGRLREMETGLGDLTARYLRAASCRPGRVTIPLGKLAEVPEFLRPKVLLGLFDLLGTGRRDIGAVHLEAIGRLWRSHGNDARISLPHGVTARLAASRLILETLPPPRTRAELVMEVQSQVMDQFNDSRMGDTVEVLCDGWDGQSMSYVGRSYAESPGIDGNIYFTSDQPVEAGEFVRVRITGAMDGELTGERTEE